MSKTLSVNPDFVQMTNLVGKSEAAPWSAEDTRESRDVEFTCGWERSFTETMEKMHKLTVSKQSNNVERDQSYESKEEEAGDEQAQEDYLTQDEGEGNDICTLMAREKLKVTSLWAPRIAKKTRSRIQNILNEDEDDSESDGFFTLSYGAGDGAGDDADDEEKEQDNDEEQDGEATEEKEYAYNQQRAIKRVLVFGE